MDEVSSSAIIEWSRGGVRGAFFRSFLGVLGEMEIGRMEIGGIVVEWGNDK